VRSGITVTLGRPLRAEAGADCPEPADHHMTMLPDVDIGSGSVRFAKDHVGLDYHNDGHSHIDALCHVAFDGVLYDGEPDTSVTAEGAQAGTIDILEDGLVGRGALLDVPRSRGVAWLEPGELVSSEDLTAAERDQGVRVGAGDIVLVRGRPRATPRRARILGHRQGQGRTAPDDRVVPGRAAGRRPGIGRQQRRRPEHDRGVAFPIYILAINAMGLHLLDYLQFEDLVHRCEDAGRWEFLLVTAPVRVRRGTGSPVNPIAIF
jgi:hypothetical protein